MEEELAVDLAGAEQDGAKTMEPLEHSCGRKVSSILEGDKDNERCTGCLYTVQYRYEKKCVVVSSWVGI